MTDKQIEKVFKNGFYCIEPCPEIKELQAKLKAKEQECERLKKELQKNFEEKDTLHLIIDRLLEASGYDTNTASAEDFEDVYEHMRYEQQQLDQLKAENEELKQFLSKEPLATQALQSAYSSYKKRSDVFYEMVKQYKQTLAEIKEIAETATKCMYATYSDDYTEGYRWLGSIILQKISEVENES